MQANHLKKIRLLKLIRKLSEFSSCMKIALKYSLLYEDNVFISPNNYQHCVSFCTLVILGGFFLVAKMLKNPPSNIGDLSFEPSQEDP